MFVAQRSLWYALLIASCVVVCGCGDTETIQSAITTARKISATAPPSDVARDSFEGEDKKVAFFAPPFPDRANPFDYVGAETAVPQQNLAGSLGDVRVLGFAKVGQQRVMLQLRGESLSLAVGDKRQGVEVLAISPPLVKLKLANLTWDVSMFDDKATPSR